jgi:hypothetical protein
MQAAGPGRVRIVFESRREEREREEEEQEERTESEGRKGKVTEQIRHHHLPSRPPLFPPFTYYYDSTVLLSLLLQHSHDIGSHDWEKRERSGREGRKG